MFRRQDLDVLALLTCPERFLPAATGFVCPRQVLPLLSLYVLRGLPPYSSLATATARSAASALLVVSTASESGSESVTTPAPACT